MRTASSALVATHLALKGKVRLPSDRVGALGFRRYMSRMEFVLPPKRPLKAAVTEHLRVIHALMLRDIKTRFGATYFGFLIGLLLPLGHIGVLLTIYVLLGRRAPIGTDVAVYLSTAIVPFIVWSYTHQKVMQAFGSNKPLIAFPIVKFVDIVMARAIVELLNSCIIVCIVAIALISYGSDLFIYDFKIFFFSVILAYFLGISTGFTFGVLYVLSPAVMIFGFVLIPLYWATSGVLFIPDGLPAQARDIVSIFPLSHIVDLGRTAFYPSYISSYPNPYYVVSVIIANFVIGLAMLRFLLPQLTTR
jgi:capsular polysaccharide transport system permease protein